MAPELRFLQASEARLEAKLINGGLTGRPPGIPLAPHPLSKLPADIVLRILQLAAYPLSAWADAEDFVATAAERAADSADRDALEEEP